MATEALPSLLDRIAAVAGIEVAQAIARARGGTRVTVPNGVGRNWLTELVGAEAAAAVIEALGPVERVDIPLGPEGGSWAEWRRARAEALARLEAAGAGAGEIARALGMTERAVRMRRARRRAAAEDGQGELFSGNPPR